MFYVNKFIDKFWHQNYLGGDFIEKEYNFIGIKLKKRMLPRLCKFVPQTYSNPKVYLSIVAVLKNEAPYLKEWIEYHKMVGVERFYLYDNESEDNVKDILQPYIDSGLVCYHKVDGNPVQNEVYRDAVYKYKNQTRWLAIIDLDEFIVPIGADDIPSLLKHYEKYPGLCVNWRMFDSNGFIEPPSDHNGLVTLNYFRTYANDDHMVNRHVKSIVNPEKVISINNPHFCYYKNRAFPVNENCVEVKGPFVKNVSFAKIVINHYFSKSKSEYLKKINRGTADRSDKRSFDDTYLNFSEWKYDYTILKYASKLEEKIYNK